LSSLHSGRCTASQSCSFVLQPKDRFGNKGTEPGEIFEATLNSQERWQDLVVVQGAVEYNTDKVLYDLTFVPTRSGEYRTVVMRYKQHTLGSLGVLTVQPGPPEAASSSAEGFGLVGAVVQETASVTITLRDVAGNPIRDVESSSMKDLLAVSTVPSNAATVQIVPLTTSAYELRWTSQVPGTFDLHITFDGEPIAGSPFRKVEVVASADADVKRPAEAYTTAEGQAVDMGAEAGKKTNFVIIPRSVGGRAVTDVTGRSNAKYRVHMGPSVGGVGSTPYTGYMVCPSAPDCEPEGQLPAFMGGGRGAWCCVDHSNAEVTGQVVVNFIWELAGKLSFFIYDARYDNLNSITDHPIYSCIDRATQQTAPLTIQVAPTALSALNSSLARYGTGGAGTCQTCGLTGAIAGVESNFALHVHDRFDNRVPGVLEDSAAPVVSLMNLATNTSDPTVSVMDGGDGVQYIKINPTISGLYRFSVMLGGSPVAGTPSLVEVMPDTVFAESSTPEGIPDTAVAGELINLGIKARDTYGNVKEGGDVQAFRAVFTGTQTFSRPLRRQGTSGSYSTSTTMTVAGKYTVAVVLMSGHVKGSPFKMTVFAGKVEANACFATGSNIRSAVAAASSSFPVYARDQFLNFIKDPAVLAAGFEAVLTSWAEPDQHRPGLHVFHKACGKMLDCPSLQKTNGTTVHAVSVRAVPTVTNPDSGSVTMNYMALMPGAYVLNISYFGKPIAKVLGDPCADLCVGEVITDS